MSRSLIPLTALAGAATLGLALLSGQQPPPPVYNASQAATGTSVYAASCASCHMADLAGRNEAPQLAGNNFMNTWRNRSTKDLFEFIQSTMPPTGENLSAARTFRGRLPAQSLRTRRSVDNRGTSSRQSHNVTAGRGRQAPGHTPPVVRRDRWSRARRLPTRARAAPIGSCRRRDRVRSGKRPVL